MYKTAIALVSSLASGAAFAAPNICEEYSGQLHAMQPVGEPVQDDICRIGSGPRWGDGALIGAETLQKFQNGTQAQAITAFLDENDFQVDPTTSPFNPAFQYCEYLGGRVKNYTTIFDGRDIGETGMCQFSDGSMIGQWSLFYHDQKLADIFQ